MKWELLAGLFGWIWILGGISALVCTGLSLFGGYSWWNVAYSVIASGVGKWLARGFEDHKRRVFFEAKLRAAGLSDKEAGAAWREAYMGKK